MGEKSITIIKDTGKLLSYADKREWLPEYSSTSFFGCLHTIITVHASPNVLNNNRFFSHHKPISSHFYKEKSCLFSQYILKAFF